MTANHKKDSNMKWRYRVHQDVWGNKERFKNLIDILRKKEKIWQL